MNGPKPGKISPPSPAALKRIQGKLQFAFETVRDGCFMPFAVTVDKGEETISALSLPPEQVWPCAEEMAARLPESATEFLVVQDGWVTAGGEDRDALLAVSSERGREGGAIYALEYRPAKGRKQAEIGRGPYLLRGCENVFRGRTSQETPEGTN